MDWLLKVGRRWAVGALLLLCLGMLAELALLVAERLNVLFGTPAAAAILMLGLMCAVIALVHGWITSEARDLET
jgi:cytochrome bd-type quinol oxidase subunit 1